MCMGGRTDDESRGVTNVTTTDKTFGKVKKKGGNKTTASAKPSAIPLNSEQRMRGTTPVQNRGVVGYNSEERMRGDDIRDTRNIYGDKKGGGKDKDKGKGGGDGGNGGGKKKKKIVNKITNVHGGGDGGGSISDKGGGAMFQRRGGNGSGADGIGSATPNLTAQSPYKNNLTLSSQAKSASLRPSIAF